MKPECRRRQSLLGLLYAISSCLWTNSEDCLDHWVHPSLSVVMAFPAEVVMQRAWHRFRIALWRHQKSIVRAFRRQKSPSLHLSRRETFGWYYSAVYSPWREQRKRARTNALENIAEAKGRFKSRPILPLSQTHYAKLGKHIWLSKVALFCVRHYSIAARKNGSGSTKREKEDASIGAIA